VLDTLDEWLGPHLVESSRLDALTPQLLGEALASKLDYAQRKIVDELAPE
jgi:ATP-dependent helicase HrpB